MARIGITQGRLLPPLGGRIQCFPVERWREEFPTAVAAGLDAIEWVYDLQGANANPLASDSGVAEIKELSQKHGIAVHSVDADYFKDRQFAAAPPSEFSDLTAHLLWLIGRCQLAGIKRISLPFVEGSQIDTPDKRLRIVEMLLDVLPFATKAGLELDLETSMEPRAFADLLDGVSDPGLMVNYDSGNSASLGYDVREELALYGKRLGGVHVKDRIRGGGTVPLGTGDADISALLLGLAQIRYSGDFILQVARGAPGEEVAWAKQNLAFLSRRLEDATAAARGVIQ